MRSWPIAASTFAFTAVTWAQQLPANATRDQLIDAALTAHEQGNHILALDLAQRAGRMLMRAPLRQFIAVELQELGRVAEALEAARQCVTEAEADHSLQHRRAVIRTCRQLVTALESRARSTTERPLEPPPHPADATTTQPANEPHTLVVRPQREVPPSEGFVRVVPQAPVPSDLHIFVRGQELPRDRWSTRFPVSPGDVHLEARARGRRPFTQHITIAAGSEMTVRLTLAEEPRVASPSRLPSAGQWAVAGTGVAMLGGALATFVIEDGLRTEQLSNGLCYNDESDRRRYCTAPRGFEIEDERATLRVVNNVLFFGGLAAVAGATVWYFVARRRASERPAAAWNFQLTPSPSGVLFGVRGAL